MAHYYNHLIQKQKAIENAREQLLALAAQISEAEINGSQDTKTLLENEFISQGQNLLVEVKAIQDRFYYLKKADIPPSFDMSWLYVTAMRAMQDVYGYGLASMHLQLIKEWPQLAEWIRDRTKR